MAISMTKPISMGVSKNVTNSEKGAKMVGKKGYILKFSLESIDNEHGHDQGG